MPVTRQRTCRVCGCTDDRACPEGCWWIAGQANLCSSCAAAASHVVKMTRKSTSRKRSLPDSVATCSCGWTNRTHVRHHRKQDAAIREHWRCVVEAA